MCKKKKDISSYKKIVLRGEFCDLIPLQESDLETVVSLRNRDNNKYFLHQERDITIEEQIIWYREYCKRDNDIYWGIWNKSKKMIGTIRLYDISGDYCEEGSCIVDSDYAKEAPYAVEAKFLLIQVAFEKLGLKYMINENKKDNKAMNSLSRQIGFVLEKETNIRGMEFNYFVLTPETYNKNKLLNIINYWKERN